MTGHGVLEKGALQALTPEIALAISITRTVLQTEEADLANDF
jgi:hypothetical protein